MSNAFFLTRQTANLMEDFVRELNADNALFFLYGDEGVGKTRTLEELVRTRFGDTRIHWIDLKAGGSGDGALVDSSAMIEEIFDKAQPDDIIVADHIEMALKKSRHQLFLSWSTDGLDKNLNLIVAGNSDYFDEMVQLAQQYQVPAKTFRQQGLNAEETAAFLGFYLFPDRPVGNLSIPPLLRSQLAMAQGNIGKLIDIAERAGDQISSSPMQEKEATRKDSRIIVSGLVVAALAIGIGWYVLGHQKQQGGMQQDEIETAADLQQTPVAEQVRAASEDAEAELEAVSVEADDAAQPQPGADATEPAQEPGPDLAAAASGEAGLAANETPGLQPVEDTSSSVVEDGGAVAEDVAAADGVAAAALEAAQAPVEVQQEPGAVVAAESTVEPVAEDSTEDASAVEPVAEDSTEDTAAVEPVAEDSTGDTTDVAKASGPEVQAPAGRLQRDLQNSLDWANRSERKTGTLQILLLHRDRFDERVYYEYIDTLASQEVDVDAIRIFTTLTAGKEVYSVVYGEFDSWKAANLARDDIPEALRENSPIARSVGGLLDEIQRLEARN